MGVFCVGRATTAAIGVAVAVPVGVVFVLGTGTFTVVSFILTDIGLGLHTG